MIITTMATMAITPVMPKKISEALKLYLSLPGSLVLLLAASVAAGCIGLMERAGEAVGVGVADAVL